MTSLLCRFKKVYLEDELELLRRAVAGLQICKCSGGGKILNFKL